jgi:hypothetical protein
LKLKRCEKSRPNVGKRKRKGKGKKTAPEKQVYRVMNHEKKYGSCGTASKT